MEAEKKEKGKGKEEEGISKEKIGRVLDGLREGKAAGIDGIPGEVWRFGGRGYGIGGFAIGSGGGRKSHDAERG